MVVSPAILTCLVYNVETEQFGGDTKQPSTQLEGENAMGRI